MGRTYHVTVILRFPFLWKKPFAQNIALLSIYRDFSFLYPWIRKDGNIYRASPLSWWVSLFITPPTWSTTIIYKIYKYKIQIQTQIPNWLESQIQYDCHGECLSSSHRQRDPPQQYTKYIKEKYKYITIQIQIIHHTANIQNTQTNAYKNKKKREKTQKPINTKQ